MQKVIPTFRLQEISLEMFNVNLDALNYEQKAKVRDMFFAELLWANKPVTIKKL